MPMCCTSPSTHSVCPVPPPVIDRLHPAAYSGMPAGSALGEGMAAGSLTVASVPQLRTYAWYALTSANTIVLLLPSRMWLGLVRLFGPKAARDGADNTPDPEPMPP